ncbi:MAG TPA: HEAT repeat domain-containing protein [Thermoleophilaceae bacterium]|nr:HEAT repeat domain-containing protein [Thermoleophilaceae bacterium]
MGKPNVRALARGGDIDGLIEAARYQDLVRRVDGLVTDAGVAIREEAIRTLGEKAGDRAAETLVRALSDPSDRVRCAAVVALYERGDADVLATAAASLREEHGESHSAAFRALFELRKPGSARALVSALLEREDERPVGEMEASIVEALLEAEGPGAERAIADLLMSALSHDREAVADRAEDLAELLAPASVDVLMAELSQGQAPFRAAAVLGRIRDARALEALVAGLAHPDPMVRRECCVALGELRDPIATEPLLRATRDPEHMVRARAGAALDRIGTAAVAVSVASLLRPLLDAAPEDARRALEDDTATLIQGSADEMTSNGEHTTLLRRLGRFIERLESARSGAAPAASRAGGANGRPVASTRALATREASKRVVSFSGGNGGRSESVPWPASARRSSASASGATED